MFKKMKELESRVEMLEVKYSQLGKEMGRMEKDIIRIMKIDKFGRGVEADIEDLCRKYSDLKKRIEEVELRVYALENVVLRLLVEIRTGGAYGEKLNAEDTD